MHRLAVRDLEQRPLSSDTRAAVVNLGDIDCRIRRRVLQEILERCMWLLYHNQKHPTIASSTSWDEFLQKGASEILNLDITPKVLERFRLDPEVLRAMEVRPGT